MANTLATKQLKVNVIKYICLYNDKLQYKDGTITYSQNVIYIKYAGDNEQYSTQFRCTPSLISNAVSSQSNYVELEAY
jgi:hypothetical protein